VNKSKTESSLLTSIVWYYFNDIYPPTHGGQRPLDPPSWWIRLWEGGAANEEEQEDTGDEVNPPLVRNIQ
jgi:Derlin-2/3